MKTLSEIKVSILDLALVTDTGSPAETFINSANLARLAENWGFHRYWLAEHHNMEGVASTATSILIGHIASATNRIRVGSGGIMLPNHAPLVIAEQFGTLATLFPGRIDLGLGRAPGTDQLTANALRRDHRAVADFESNVVELQKYLSAGNKNAAVRAIPGEGLDIPVWILGSSTDSAFLSAQLGLPYAFASHFAPAQLLDAIAIYRKNFTPSTKLKTPYVMACVNVIASDTTDAAIRIATSFKKLFLGILSGNRSKLSAPVDPREISYHEEEVLRQMIRYSFIGSKETIQMELQRFVDVTQTDEVMINSPIHSHQQRLRSYEIASELFRKSP